MDDSGVGELCSVLLTDLPEDWFRLSDCCKLEKLKAGNFIALSSWDEQKRAAVARMRKAPGIPPTVDIRGCGAALIIKHKDASIALQLSSTEDRNLLISTARGLNIKVVEEAFNTFKVSGSLELVTEFCNLLDEKILAACLDPHHVDKDQGGASVSAVSPDSENASSRDVSGVTTKLKSLGDCWNRNILILMMCLDQTHGCVVKPSTREVIADANSNQNLFCHQYDSYSRQKLKSEVLKISKHISITSLKKEMEMLKEKYNQCGYFISEDLGEIVLVSLSTQQFESFLSFLKIFLGVSYTLPCGRVLSLLSGNIVQEKVDVIVNAANGSLEHAGGVAKAINDASHGEVQYFSRQFMRHHAILQAGEVAITSAGQYLDCKQIIHAVGPVRDQRNCRDIMNTLVHAILDKGEELGAESIALPAISTGIFGMSKDLVAECLFRQIPAHRFQMSLPVLSDIRVVIIDQPTFSSFHKNFTKILLSKTQRLARPLDYSSAGVYSTVMRQLLSQHFSGHPSQPRQIDQCHTCLKRCHTHEKNFLRLHCGHWSCSDCATMYGYYCFLCDPYVEPGSAKLQ